MVIYPDGNSHGEKLVNGHKSKRQVSAAPLAVLVAGVVWAFLRRRRKKQEPGHVSHVCVCVPWLGEECMYINNIVYIHIYVYV